jgi:hypothetical protein
LKTQKEGKVEKKTGRMVLTIAVPALAVLALVAAFLSNRWVTVVIMMTWDISTVLSRPIVSVFQRIQIQ